MIKKAISITTNESKIYKQILSFMNFLLNATPQERAVLAEIIRLNNEYEILDPEKRAKFILSTSMRQEMREITGIETKQFNGILTRLRNKTLFGKPFLDKNNILHSELQFKPDEEGFKIELVMKIVKDEIAPKEEIKAVSDNTVTKEDKAIKEQDNVTTISDSTIPKPADIAKPSNGTENIVVSEFTTDDITLDL